MAIARDTTGTKANNGNANPVTYSFNNAGGNFSVLGLFYDKNATITSVTYAGNTATVASTTTMTGWVYKLSIVYIESSATGTNNWVVNFSGSTAGAVCITQAQSYTGVPSSSAVDSTNTNYITTTGSQSQALSLTPTTSTGWMVGYCVSGNSGTLTAGTNTSIISGGSIQDALFDTFGTIGSGSQTLNLNWSSLSGGGEGAAMAGFSFKSAIAAISPFNKFPKQAVNRASTY